MSSDRIDIQKLPSGVPGLDDVLGGGLPEFSFNLIAGSPGCGKTSLAHQIMFANASPEAPALYISIVGEPPLKMLRYQQQYSFFDRKKIQDGSIRYLHLGGDILIEGLERVLEHIVQEIKTANPKLVFVDSFRSVVRASSTPGQTDLQHFVQRLSLYLTSWETTSFLIGEYDIKERDSDPVFTIADGILWLGQATNRNSIVRQVQIAKMRGQGQIPGLHTMKITDAGLRVYPRMPSPDGPREKHEDMAVRRKTGVKGLDQMLGGGIPAGYSVMVVGPSGTGKTILSTQFIKEGIENGEAGVIAVFEKRPEEYLSTAPQAKELGKFMAKGKLKMLYLRPLDLSVDETLEELASAVKEIGAKRVVIDSLSGFEIALAPNFREDFRESLYRLVGALTGLGVTVMMTAELVQSYTELRLSQHGISFLTDGIIVQQFVEDRGALRKALVVAKMRNLDHDNVFRFYEISDKGMVMGEALTDYEGILTGNATRVAAGKGKAK